MIPTFLKLKNFIKAPYQSDSYTKIEGKEFFFLLLITFAIVIPYALILEAAGMDQFDNLLETLIKDYKWLVAVLAIVIAPLLEEPIYRLHLDFKKSSIWWGIGLSVFAISEVWIPVVLLLIWLFYLLVTVSDGKKPNLKYSIFISATLFALVHLGNFKDFDYAQYFYWVPFLVGAQFLIGLVLSYIRLNHGMKTAILFHGVYNAILTIPAVYFYEA
jgi:membrane protease YdiL (CAAX protease family)